MLNNKAIKQNTFFVTYDIHYSKKMSQIVLRYCKNVCNKNVNNEQSAATMHAHRCFQKNAREQHQIRAKKDTKLDLLRIKPLPFGKFHFFCINVLYLHILSP